MEELTFHLPNLRNSKGEQTDFEGPLSLILQLLSRNRVEIQDISVSEIVDQYMDYLRSMEQMDLEVAGEFLTMASYLLYIKAKTLLEGTRDVEEMSQLISSLEAQQRKETLERMKLAAIWLAERSRRGEGLFTRAQEPIAGPPEYRLAHQAQELLRILRELLGREREPGEKPGRLLIPAPFTYSVQEKTDEILLRLRDSGAIQLDALFRESRSRSELTAALLAVLELYRMEQVSLTETEAGFRMTRFEGTMEQEG